MSSSRKRKDDSEDRAAKLAKKVSEHLRKHGSQTASGRYGYRDTDNPFNDEKISERFVWGKKIEKDVEAGKSIKDYSAAAHAKRDREREEEIEKVRRRREEREAERAAIAEELDMVQRERARAEAVDLERQEDIFHLEQAKIRAQQRLAAGRPKAIDVITNNLFLLDGFDATASDEAGVFVCALPLDQLEELREDIGEYSRLDALNRDHVDFWRALGRVTQHALLEAKQEVEKLAGWHPSLDADIAMMLDGKSLSELETLEAGVREQVDRGDAPDPDFYHAILQRLDVYKAKAVLKEFHERIVMAELGRVERGERVMGKTEDGVKEEEEELKGEEEELKGEEEELKGDHEGRGTSRAEAAVNGEENPEEIKLEDSDEEGGVHPDAANGPTGENVGPTKPVGPVGPVRPKPGAIGPVGPPPGAMGPVGPQPPPASFAEELQRLAMANPRAETSDPLMRHIQAASHQTDEDRKLQAIAKSAMGRDIDEADLLGEYGGEVEVADDRPGHVVKPKYFNKIHQRFHWTKYVAPIGRAASLASRPQRADSDAGAPHSHTHSLAPIATPHLSGTIERTTTGTIRRRKS